MKVTIRDGFKGEYNLKKDIDKNFPYELEENQFK